MRRGAIAAARKKLRIVTDLTTMLGGQTSPGRSGPTSLLTCLPGQTRHAPGHLLDRFHDLHQCFFACHPPDTLLCCVP